MGYTKGYNLNQRQQVIDKLKVLTPKRQHDLVKMYPRFFKDMNIEPAPLDTRSWFEKMMHKLYDLCH